MWYRTHGHLQKRGTFRFAVTQVFMEKVELEMPNLRWVLITLHFTMTQW